jgi:hypothetical protein
MTMATATSTVTPNLTPKELVKFMVTATSTVTASKYRNDLMNFTILSPRRYIVPYIPSKLIYKTRCHDKLDRWCSRFRVSHRVNNQ